MLCMCVVLRVVYMCGPQPWTTTPSAAHKWQFRVNARELKGWLAPPGALAHLLGGFHQVADLLHARRDLALRAAVAHNSACLLGNDNLHRGLNVEIMVQGRG